MFDIFAEKFDALSDIGKNVMKKLIFSEILYYICSVHFEKSKTKADNNRKVPGIWSKKKIVSLAYWGKSD